VDYPYSTTAVTANLECIKILLNAVISDDINLSTIDLEDFYLGTNLPHPEYIRIPTKFPPKTVIDFYKLKPYLHTGPYIVRSSRHTIFAHLLQHGYTQLSHSYSGTRTAPYDFPSSWTILLLFGVKNQAWITSSKPYVNCTQSK
jgi:hypothetical protein